MHFISKILLATGFAVSVAGCSNTDNGSNKLSNLFFFNSTEAPDVAKPATEAIYCPQVDIFEGGAYLPIGRGGQATITDLARECNVREDGTVLVKVGVAGRVVVASAGGRTTVPVHFRIKAGSKVIAQRSQSANASIANGALNGEFAVVQEGLVVPAANIQNFDIEVGLGSGRARAPAPATESYDQ